MQLKLGLFLIAIHIDLEFHSEKFSGTKNSRRETNEQQNSESLEKSFHCELFLTLVSFCALQGSYFVETS